MHEFIAIDESDLIETGVKAYEDETKEALYAGDERRFMINSFAYMILLAVREVNYGINQEFSTTAAEDGLQVLGDDYQVERLPSEKAIVNVRFTLMSGMTGSTSIPEGTRVTYDGVHFFATSKAVIASAETECVDIECRATASGDDGYNNISAGSISVLVDNVSGVVSVSNTDTSSGGSDIEDLEAWRERINLKKRGLNTAGGVDAYIYHIKSVDSSIGDVKILNPGDATVHAVILCKNGVIPNDGLLARVKEKVSAKDKRPLTDTFDVSVPNVINYGIDFHYTIPPSDMDRVELIKKQICEAVVEYRSQVESHLGTDIIPDSLRRYLLNAGASTVVITAPVDTVVEDDSVAKLLGEISMTYDGMR
ncbi:MAG: baseplate J/gp47 family protein [Eubacterium sp.]|nr:baseplate J/gp47 family protein [Eubacterium sp.]